MRKFIANEWMTLDGVVQAPGYADEDVTGGFGHGGWHTRYLDDLSMNWVIENVRGAGGYLLGRATHEWLPALFAHDLGEPLAFGVEHVGGDRQPEHRREATALVEDRRRDAAEIGVELLAVDREPVGPDALELRDQLLRGGDRLRRERAQAARDVAGDAVGVQQRKHDLAHRQPVR